MLSDEENGTSKRYSQNGWSETVVVVDAEAREAEAAGAACSRGISYVRMSGATAVPVGTLPPTRIDPSPESTWSGHLIAIWCCSEDAQELSVVADGKIL